MPFHTKRCSCGTPIEIVRTFEAEPHHHTEATIDRGCVTCKSKRREIPHWSPPAPVFDGHHAEPAY